MLCGRARIRVVAPHRRIGCGPAPPSASARRASLRRGGGYQRIELEDCDLTAPQADYELLAVHEALEGLEKAHPLQAQVVKLRYFGGRTIEETAKILGLSVATINNYWAFSRAWLLERIEER